MVLEYLVDVFLIYQMKVWKQVEKSQVIFVADFDPSFFSPF